MDWLGYTVYRSGGVDRQRGTSPYPLLSILDFSNLILLFLVCFHISLSSTVLFKRDLQNNHDFIGFGFFLLSSFPPARPTNTLRHPHYATNVPCYLLVGNIRLGS